jgi:chemotaxis protein methyltransferase CheR
MPTALPHALLPQLSRLLETKMGLYYPEKSWGDLERRIAAAVPALGMTDTETCVRQLLSTSLTPRRIEILARHLTIGETYFFRDKGCFDALQEHIFPELMRVCARTHRQLRIWSAGCCTGEEPYSIAILLDRLAPSIGTSNATILATDINPTFLEKAAEGLYSEWSFRGTPAWIKERYFKRRKNGRFEILPHIRKRVTFSYLNLAEETYPAISSGTDRMDVIFCRNVLMYFSPDRITKIGANFHRSLVNGGWLVLSPVEAWGNLFPQFKRTTFPDAILYLKTKSVEPYGNKLKNLVPAPNAQRYAVCTPTPVLAPPLYPNEGETHVLREDTQEETPIRGATDEPAQAAAMHDAAVHQANHEQFDMLCYKARSYANRGELTEAIRWCEKAIAVNKLNPATHYLLATICQELGQSETAKLSLTRTLYLDPAFVLAHFALGNLCMSDDQHREAERHFDNALALLALRSHDELLPESSGLTTGRLRDIITSARSSIPLGPQERRA